MHCSQSRGVTVAQVILVHFVEVRILTGLPFFCLFSGAVGDTGLRIIQEKAFVTACGNKFPPLFQRFFLFPGTCRAVMILCGRLPPLTLRLTFGVESLQDYHFFVMIPEKRIIT